MVFAPDNAEKSFREQCKEADKNLSLALKRGEGKVGKTEREKILDKVVELQIISDKLHDAIRKEYKADMNHEFNLTLFNCFSCAMLLVATKHEHITPTVSIIGLFVVVAMTAYIFKTGRKFKQKAEERYEELSKNTIDGVNAYIDHYRE